MQQKQSMPQPEMGGIGAGALGPDTPPLRESRSLTYFTDETLQEGVERHLHDIVEADVIQRLQAGSPLATVLENAIPYHFMHFPPCCGIVKPLGCHRREWNATCTILWKAMSFRGCSWTLYLLRWFCVTAVLPFIITSLSYVHHICARWPLRPRHPGFCRGCKSARVALSKMP